MKTNWLRSAAKGVLPPATSRRRPQSLPDTLQPAAERIGNRREGMSLTLALTEAQEKRVIALAQAQGQSVPAFVGSLVRRAIDEAKAQ